MVGWWGTVCYVEDCQANRPVLEPTQRERLTSKAFKSHGSSVIFDVVPQHGGIDVEPIRLPATAMRGPSPAWRPVSVRYRSVRLGSET